MIQTTPFNEFAKEYDDWYNKYPFVFESELAAIREQLGKLSENISGIEVGMGTGRFAEALGIKEGIEPVEEMSRYALKRGREVMKARAETLPYRDLAYDFVLFVTICHLDKPLAAFKEAHRVLKKGGAIVIGFLDKDQAIAQSYEAKRNSSRFYKNATFFTVGKLTKMLKEAGFHDLEFVQTLFGNLDDIKEVQATLPGFGEGSFVVVKAQKK